MGHTYHIIIPVGLILTLLIPFIGMIAESIKNYNKEG
jgi:hypothetical protein